jgi:hypothetical protein
VRLSFSDCDVCCCSLCAFVLLLSEAASVRPIVPQVSLPRASESGRAYVAPVWAWNDAEEIEWIRSALIKRGYKKEELDAQPFKKYDLIAMYVKRQSVATSQSH